MKIVQQANLPELGVSHNPEIKKKTLIQKGEIPQLMMYGTAVFKEGQSVAEHHHPTMFEVFYILSGKAVFTVNGEAHILGPGHCITIDPGETHSQHNPYEEDAILSYFGIAVDP